jgi:hypothetical protein
MLPKRRLIQPHRFSLAHVALELATGEALAWGAAMLESVPVSDEEAERDDFGLGRSLGVRLGLDVAVGVGVAMGAVPELGAALAMV